MRQEKLKGIQKGKKRGEIKEKGELLYILTFIVK
jgi:hypothetical protein